MLQKQINYGNPAWEDGGRRPPYREIELFVVWEYISGLLPPALVVTSEGFFDRHIHACQNMDAGHFGQWHFLEALMIFKVVLETDREDGGFNVSCPAIPGCHSQGDTEEEALENIREAILGCLEVLNERAHQKAHEDTKIFEVAVG